MDVVVFVAPALRKPRKLLPPESRRQRLFPLKGDVVERSRERMPSGARRNFRAHNLRLGFHSYRASARRPVDQADFNLDRRPRLNPLRTEKEDSAGTDVASLQGFDQKFPLPGNALHAQWESEFGSRVSAPLFRRSNGMCRNARDAFRFGARRPQRRIGKQSCRRGQQLFQGGIDATGLGLVREFLILSCAHRSPFVSYAWRRSRTLSSAPPHRVNSGSRRSCPTAYSRGNHSRLFSLLVRRLPGQISLTARFG